MDQFDSLAPLSATKFQRTGSKRLLSVALIALTATAVFWRMLHSSEHAHINRLTTLAVNAVRDDLLSDLNERINSLRRLAQVSALQSTPSSADWRALAAEYIQHTPGCISVEFVDTSFHVRQVVSENGDETELGANLARDPVIWPILDSARSGTPFAASPTIFLRSGKKLRRIAVAVHRQNEFRGFVVANFDINRAVAAMLEDVSGLGYFITVTEHEREVYASPLPNRTNFAEWGQTAALELPGMDWKVSVWPSPELLADQRTRLPGIALALGLALTGLLLITIHFALVANRRSHDTEAANAALHTALNSQQTVSSQLQQSQARFAGVLEMSADAIISTDEQQRITLFNKGAEAVFGYAASEVLGRKLDLLMPARFTAAHRGHVERFAGSQGQFHQAAPARMVVGLRKDGTEFPIDASISRLHINGETIYTAILRDITERERATDALLRAHEELEQRVSERTAELRRRNASLAAEIAERKQAQGLLGQLSARLLQLQDEERRRIARELHDSTAQYLAALAINLGLAQDEAGQLPGGMRKLLADSCGLVERCAAEIRTVSYLLHPPVLDDLGLAAAIESYAEGYQRRSGLSVDLDLQPDLGRLPADIERTFFRTMQECLTNIHKHSGANRATIRLHRRNGEAELVIADNGRGMGDRSRGTKDLSVKLGVGIAGMYERVRQLNGLLNIESSDRGTSVCAVIPLTASADTHGERAAVATPLPRPSAC